MEWRRIQSGVYLRSLVVCALALPAFGQFSGLAVTDDGGQVYFSSPLMLGSDPRSAAMPESRVYRWSAKGVELMGERGELAPGGSTVSSSSSDGASGAQVSGDGGLYGYTLYNACAQPGTSDGCAGIQSQAVLRGTINATAGQGVLQLSRNGRWALVVPQASPIRTSPPALWDIQNASVSYPPSAAALYGSVASDGSVVTDGGMWRAGTVTPFGIAGRFVPLAISGNGKVLVYNALLTDAAGRVNGVALTARDLASGKDVAIYTPAAGSGLLPTFMGVNDDGGKVLYRVSGARGAGSTYLADAAAGSSMAIPLVEGESASEGAINGPGDLVVLATTFHRLLKIGLLNGALNSSQVIVPVTAYSSIPNLSPGSIVRLAAPVPPGSTGRVLIDGAAAPVVASTSDQLIVQTPWEQRTGSATITFDYATQSPFRQMQTATVFPFNPMFETADAGTYPLLGIKMIKADFSGLVTSQPTPGQIVHTYMTGLGRVQGAVETGVAAPLDSLRRINGTFQCRFFPYKAAADTLFAGLAPGLIGIYQVTFRFPNETASGPLTGGECSLTGPEGGAGFTFVSATTSLP